MKLYKFSGASMLTVDEKSRLLVPAEVRRKLDAEDTDVFVIKIGNNGKIWLYPERFYDAKVYDDGKPGEVFDEIDPSPEQLERMLSESADIHRVPMDKAGRILLPEPVLSLTGLGREVALLGVFNHLQLWSREDYAKRQLTKSAESQQKQ